MGIDLVLVCQHLKLLLGDLRLIHLLLGVLDLLIHLLLFVQHMIQTVHDCADLIFPLYFHPLTGLIHDSLDKTVHLMHRTYKPFITEPHQQG